MAPVHKMAAPLVAGEIRERLIYFFSYRFIFTTLFHDLIRLYRYCVNRGRMVLPERGAGVCLFLEDELDEGGVEVVSDVLVLLLLSHKLV
ncbi:hypothetical protein RR48_09736 [Papilio machaon]|uniref:Uncharacterized protein n=1 Tax=Papilio machaon TaxID=76193 RepID=A0A194RD98_PAPMA|nr:hypothetical protein RR48_09736 [Papilio machaon]